MPYTILCKEHYEEMPSTGPSGEVVGKETFCYNCPQCGYDKGFYKSDLEEVKQLTIDSKTPRNPHRILKDMLKESEDRIIPHSENFGYFTLLIYEEGSIVLR